MFLKVVVLLVSLKILLFFYTEHFILLPNHDIHRIFITNLIYFRFNVLDNKSKYKGKSKRSTSAMVCFYCLRAKLIHIFKPLMPKITVLIASDKIIT